MSLSKRTNVFLRDVVCISAKEDLPLKWPWWIAWFFKQRKLFSFFWRHLDRAYDHFLDTHQKTVTVFWYSKLNKKQVRAATYGSTMLDKSSDEHYGPQLSAVLQYVVDRVPWHATYLSDLLISVRTQMDYLHTSQLLKNYHIGKRLVSETYYGVSVISDHLNGLQTKVGGSFPTGTASCIPYF